jgi:cell division protease FtsH
LRVTPGPNYTTGPIDKAPLVAFGEEDHLHRRNLTMESPSRQPPHSRGPLWFFPVLLVFGLIVFGLAMGDRQPPRSPSYGEFLGQVERGEVRAVTLKPERNSVEVETRGGETYKTAYPNNTEAELLRKLRAEQVAIDVEPKGSGWAGYLMYLAPIALLAVFWLVLVRRSSAASSGLRRMTRSPAQRADVNPPKITFRDVAGVDEAVEELQEIKEFLENPKKFQALGARIPKGVLLYGPPGTGKTLLARAVAGEAGVPFFSISGSDFVEMFVGVGASRVRDLFEQAKQNSPCIIFMDEIDAVGRHRGAGLGGGHDEREQTLNQLLVEMDGFEMKDNIILIAATNRPDILDPALLRPGRFDRQIVVDRPDRKGRQKILEVHTRGKPLAKGIDLDTLAGQTPGFTGADLQNLVNEAALLAARQGKREIDHLQLEEGIMRVIAGPEKKTRVMSEKERRITAFHEMGHALVAHYLHHTDPVHKISVISRGQALGYTISLPTEDKFLTTRAELSDTMAMTLGGRAAEEIVFGEVTTGASNDLEKVTATAKQMVMRFGMSDKLGPRVFGHDHGQPFLGREFSSEPDYSDEIAREIDDEIRRIVEEAHQAARDILEQHRTKLDLTSEILLKRETIEREQFIELLDGKTEEEVFGHEQPALPAPPPAPEAPERKPERAPKPLPRPGLAGGTAEMRANPPADRPKR